MTTRTWFNCLDQFEIGDLDLRLPEGRHRAKNQPTIRIRRRRYARCGAPFSSAGANNRDAADGSAKAPAPAVPFKQAVHVRIVGACTDTRCNAGILTRHLAPGLTARDDCPTCRALGFRTQVTPQTDTRAVEDDATGRPGATPIGGAE